MKRLHLAEALSLPLDAVTQKLAFLGISGSGKTYGAGRFVEELLGAGAQVVIIDTIGNWWGLRLDRDGQAPGISIPILGGERGDVALEPGAGAPVAELAATSRSPLIVDVSDFTVGEMRRFVADFAEALLRAKKRAASPLMVVWEECQDVVPQRVMGESARVVGAVEKLIKKGRNYGVGTVLISQRAAAVNKDVLNQIESLFVFRMNAKHDRKAIEDWIVHQQIDVGALVDELPSLPTGDCFCWSPQWLRLLKRVHIAAKRTFDSSATPEFGGEVRAGELAPVDLERFRTTMSVAIARAEENDPRALRKRIIELEKRLRDRPAVAPAAAVEVPVVAPEHVAGLHRLVLQLGDISKEIGSRSVELGTALGRVRAPAAPPPPVVARAPALAASPAPARRARAEAVAAAGSGEERLSNPQQRMLEALAAFEAIGLRVMSRNNLAVFSDQSPRSSSFMNNLGSVRTTRLLHYPSTGNVALTDMGRTRAGAVAGPATLAELHGAWISKLSAPQGRMLQTLIRTYPDALTREELANETSQSPNSSSFMNNLGALRSLGVIEYPERGRAAATELLFPAALVAGGRAATQQR